MMMKEFEELTGIYPSAELYSMIEQAYAKYDGDKSAFCKAYKTNADGIAEQVARAADMKAYKAQEYLTENEKAHGEKIDALRKEIARLTEQLNKELEWRPYGNSSNMTDEDYEGLTRIGEKMSDYEAREFIAKELGFEFEKIAILSEIPAYEMNRHKAVRQCGTSKRPPFYCSTDFNYIRFDVAGYQYEFVNGDLRFFLD